MRFITTSIIFILFFLLSVKSFCQFDRGLDYNSKVETLSMEEGLTSNAVNCIQQDKSGFLWVGTNAGLNKYDGYQFETFLYEIDDTSSLRHSYIKDILVGNRGSMWLATWGGGINIFDFEKRIFTSFSTKFKTDSIDIHNHIDFIHQSIDGSFWFGTLYGLIHFHPETTAFDKYISSSSDTNSISDNWINEILETRDGCTLFVGSDGRLNVFNPLKKNFQRFEIRKKSGKKELIIITKLFEDSHQNLLVGTNNGLYSFNRNKGEFINIIKEESTINVLSENPINDFLEFNDTLLWIGTSGSGIIELKRLQEDNMKFVKSGLPNILSYNWIKKIYRDVQGNIWIGTNHSGLKVIYNRKKQFYHFETENNVAQTITTDKANNLWIGTSDGLYQYNRDTKAKKKYTIDSGLSSNTIRSLFVDDMRLLIGTERGLDVMDIKTREITLWREENNILNTPIVTIKTDAEGNFWLGSDQKGLIFINRHTGEVSNYTASSEDLSIGNYNVTSLCFETKNLLWVGIYGGGINLFDTQKREFVKRYLHVSDSKYSINDNNVLDIYKDKKGNIWIATIDGGLNHFDPQAGIFKAYLKKDGLPSNSVLGITEDDAKHLWIGTHNGLVKFDIESSKIKYFDTSDGLLDNKFEPRSVFKDQQGMVYFGTNRGVNGFYPAEINDNLEEPVLLLTNFRIFNKEIDYTDKKAPLQKHITFTNSVVLKHNQTAINIEYVALNYISSTKNKYAFRMDGLEKEWREVGNQRVANYSNIPPGEYIFMVKASNNDGVWTKEPLVLSIKVMPHPLKSKLAYSIYIILFLLLNVFIIRLFKRFSERKHQVEVARIERDKEKQLTQFKLQFFTNISHELRTHLTLIVSPINKLLKKGSHSDENKILLNQIDLNVTRLLKLTDEIIDFRRVEQGKVSLEMQRTNIVEFVNEIYQQFKPIAEENDFSFDFQADLPEIIWCFDEEKLKKILFNLLTNAIKYTPNRGQINLSVIRINDEKLRIGVKDNGIGIEQEHLPQMFVRFFNPGKDHELHDVHKSSGIGLALVKQLVELHGGQIYVESESGKGSHFYFDLPKHECPEVETPLTATKANLVTDEKWEEILKLERDNVQKDLVLTNEFHTDEVPSVLIVDDNKEICLALNELLKNKYKIHVAGDGKKALEITDNENIDIVLSDVMMPVMDGIELCNTLKSNLKTSHIPVVLLTAKTGIDNELQGLRTGADAYITKPFNDEKVLLTVGNILDNRKKIQLFFKGDKQEKEMEPIINPLDKKLIDKVLRLINEKISDTGFSVDELGQEAGLSRMHLFRKMKALTGESPSDLIKKVRLEKSKELLEKGEISISNIAYDTGFSTPGNFSTAFKKFFGDTPAQYRAKYFSGSSKSF